MEENEGLKELLLDALACEYHLAKIFEERSKDSLNPYERSLFEKMRDECRIHAERIRDALKILGLGDGEEVPPFPEKLSIFKEKREFKSSLEKDLFYTKMHLKLEEELMEVYKWLSEEVEDRMARVLFKANYEDEVIHHQEFSSLLKAIEGVLRERAEMEE